MARPGAGEALQGPLAGLPDVERLLPRAAQLFAAVGCGVGRLGGHSRRNGALGGRW